MTTDEKGGTEKMFNIATKPVGEQKTMLRLLLVNLGGVFVETNRLCYEKYEIFQV